MATIKAITTALHNEIQRNELLQMHLNKIIISTLGRLKIENDYCCFIDLKRIKLGAEIIFHDGGTTYDEDLDCMTYLYYADIKSRVPIDQDYKLYFSLDEGILCFLSER